MSPQLVILLLQEVAQLAPGIVQQFENGEVSPEDQKKLFDAVGNLGVIFMGAEWKKSDDT